MQTLAENGFYAQVRGQRLESDATKVTDQKTNKTDTASFDQKGFNSTKLGVEKEDYAVSVDYSNNKGTSLYDAYTFDGTLLKQDFENEIINLRSRLNVTDQFELNTRLSQFNDEVDQKDSTDYVHSKRHKKLNFMANGTSLLANLLFLGLPIANLERHLILWYAL